MFEPVILYVLTTAVGFYEWEPRLDSEFYGPIYSTIFCTIPSRGASR